jgi:acyl-CoA reductase-like NAD-dependent aldehyde dehydrogenase
LEIINWIERAENACFEAYNYINGTRYPITGEQVIEKCSARNDTLLYQFPNGSIDDVDAAVQAASVASISGVWSKATLSERKSVLLKLASLIDENAEELALFESVDVGKPITNALNGDIPSASETIRDAAEGLDKLYSHSAIDGAGPNLMCQIRKPVGVVAAIVGWNFPLVLAVCKVAPALAMGNSVVLKPSEFSPLSACRLAELATQAGLPDGVLNVVNGSGAVVGKALALHTDVALLSFTGSTATGKQLMVSAGRSNMKRLMLECGGKSPFIVFDDCPSDLDFVAACAVGDAFQNQGQVCSAGTRLLVHESIYDALIPKVIEQAQQLVPADPLLAETTFGPLINQQQKAKVQGFIARAVTEDAELLLGGKTAIDDMKGCFIAPTIFGNVNPQSELAQEEIFGPVLSIFKFRDEAEAIALANNSQFGLQASVMTQSLGRYQRLVQNLDAGLVMVYGTSLLAAGGISPGVEAHKQSGFGVEQGLAGLASYSISSVAVSMV